MGLLCAARRSERRGSGDSAAKGARSKGEPSAGARHRKRSGRRDQEACSGSALWSRTLGRRAAAGRTQSWYHSTVAGRATRHRGHLNPHARRNHRTIADMTIGEVALASLRLRHGQHQRRSITREFCYLKYQIRCLALGRLVYYADLDHTDDAKIASDASITLMLRILSYAGCLLPCWQASLECGRSVPKKVDHPAPPPGTPIGRPIVEFLHRRPMGREFSFAALGRVSAEPIDGLAP